MSTPDTSERWQLSLVEKIVGAVIIGLLGWQTFTVQQMSVDVAVMKAQLNREENERFRVQDGARLEDRIKRLEERIQSIEEEIGVMN
jgi:hypothetical protein